jgi:beta-glucosidase
VTAPDDRRRRRAVAHPGRHRDHILGRVNATLNVFSHGVAHPLGALLAAAAAGSIGVRGGIAIGGAGTAVSILLLVLLPLPRVRQLSDADKVDGEPIQSRNGRPTAAGCARKGRMTDSRRPALRDAARPIWALGIEDTFVPQAATRTGRILDEYVLTGHDRHWRTDLRAIADLGVEWLRYGIPWYLVNPSPGAFDWSWTDEVLPYLVEDLGIHPILDLVHYGAPLWLEGTFLSAEYPRRVAAYAEAVANRYGRLVRQWTPLNEPTVHAHFSGRIGLWPPYRRGERGFAQVLVALARGMALTVDAIRDVVPDAEIVHVEALSVTAVTDPALAARGERARALPYLALDLVEGRVDETHVLHPWLLENRVSERELDELVGRERRMDIFGGNFYPQMSCISLEGEIDRPRFRRRRGTAADLEAVMREAAARSGRPVMLTETSMYGSIASRRRWLEAVALSTDVLCREEIAFLGVTWFPAFSLFSWNYRRGRRDADAYLSHMGLWDLVPDGTGELARVPTGLVQRYQQLVTASRPKRP